MDHTTANDVTARHFRDDFSRSRKLVCRGRLFHIRCCAHIVNLIVQDNLSEIVDITKNIRKSVDFINRSDRRMLVFGETVM